MVVAPPLKGSTSSSSTTNTTRLRPRNNVTTAGGGRGFKVYADTHTNIPNHSLPAPAPPKRKSAPIKTEFAQAKGRLNNYDKGCKKNDVPAEKNVGRRVLGDISNTHGNPLRNKFSNGSKTRSSAVFGARSASSSSSKPLMGKLRASQSQITGDSRTMPREKVQSKVSKALNVDLKTKVWGQKTIINIGRKSVTSRLPPTRKSLPVLKRVEEMALRNTNKESADKSDKGKGKHGFPVKSKVGMKVVPQVSNTRSHLWRNRVSDGFITMPSSFQSKGDARASSRRLIEPTVIATALGKIQRTSQTKLTSGLNKSTLRPSISSKRKEDSATSASSEHTASAVSFDQSVGGKISLENNSNIDTTSSHIFERGKSDRRNSYTSSLIARSKLLKEHGKLTKQEFLPNIYDESNHLEVVEYVDEIYQYYWVMEAQNYPLKNYMEVQTEITAQMRGILINWLIEVHSNFHLMPETLYLMITLFDHYLSLVSIKKNEMQLVGLTALLLASKYEDFWHPKVVELISISAEWYTRDQMLEMEKAILKKLKFRLNMPTPYVFMLRFLRAAQSDKKLESLAFYLVELCLVEHEALSFKPSLLCASAIYLARCTLQLTPAWTPLLVKHAHYEESELRGCAEMILRFQRAARTGVLKVSYEKYMSNDSGRVAAIKPLDRVPPHQAVS